MAVFTNQEATIECIRQKDIIYTLFNTHSSQLILINMKYTE